MSSTRFQLRNLGTPFLVLAVAAGYWGMGRLSFLSSVNHGIVTLVVFGAEGVALGSVLRWGPWAALGVFLGQLGLAHSMGLPWVPALAVAAINAAEALLGGWLARRTGLDPDLNRLRDVLLLLALSALLLQPFSAILGVGALWVTGRMPTNALWPSGFAWWMGNALGQCILAPVVLVASKPIRTWFPGPVLATAALVLLGLAGFGLMGGPGLSSFAMALTLFFPLVVLMSAVFGVEGGAFAGLGFSAVAIGVTSLGLGPFRHSWLELNLFLAGGVLTGLALGAMFTERRRHEALLRSQKQALETTNEQLSKALAHVQTLEGLLPICAYCKQIRDDSGYWNGLEEYFASRSHIQFTHGICPECREKFFGDMNRPGASLVEGPGDATVRQDAL